MPLARPSYRRRLNIDSSLFAWSKSRPATANPTRDNLLSDLLWAANGVNRPSGDRTAPYWRHIMVIDIYAAMADGVWLYDPKARTTFARSAELRISSVPRRSILSMSRMGSA